MYASGADQTSSSEKRLQQQKLDDIVGMLLSAGYFRARISALTPFDKVCKRCQRERDDAVCLPLCLCSALFLSPMFSGCIFLEIYARGVGVGVEGGHVISARVLNALFC